MIETITSLQNPRIKKALRLHTARGRKTQNRIIVFGHREVTRAINAGVCFEELFTTTSTGGVEIQAIQDSIHDKSQTGFFSLSPELFSKLSYGERTEEIIGIAARPETELRSLNLPDNSLVLVAEGIEKPGNLGAMIRSCDACGVSAILLADPLTDFFHPNSIRSSMATVFSLPLASAPTETIQAWLNQLGYGVFTAGLDEATDFYQSDLVGNTAIVIGNEANGLSQKWNQAGYHRVKLPMHGLADSLNASVAASVMLYEAVRQRRGVS